MRPQMFKNSIALEWLVHEQKAPLLAECRQQGRIEHRATAHLGLDTPFLAAHQIVERNPNHRWAIARP